MVNIGFLLIFGLLLYNVVDNFGHIGGLLTGFVYGLIQIPSDEFTDPRRARPITKLFGIVAIGVFVLTSVFSIFLLLRSR